MSQRVLTGQGLMGGLGVFHWQVSEATFENFLIIFPLLQSVFFSALGGDKRLQLPKTLQEIKILKLVLLPHTNIFFFPTPRTVSRVIGTTEG